MNEYMAGERFDVAKFLRAHGDEARYQNSGEPFTTIEIDISRLERLPPLVVAEPEPITRKEWLEAFLRWQLDEGVDVELLAKAVNQSHVAGMSRGISSFSQQKLDGWLGPANNDGDHLYAIPEKYRT